VYFAIAIMTVLTVAAAAFLVAPRMAAGRIVYDVEPDRPHAFGYRMAWLAVRTRDTGALLECLGLDEPEVANWKSGLGTVYDEALGECRIFVSPPVNGWSFVVGTALPAPMGRRFIDKSVPLLLHLGERFVEVQYFCSYPSLDYFAWARVLDGKMIRAFAINDEGVIWNRGKPTKEERAMGLKLFELRGVRGRKGDAGGEILLYPTEEHLMQLASKWSLDPTALARHGAAVASANGVVGYAPMVWRSERIARAA
jgi:hypothetical protein